MAKKTSRVRHLRDRGGRYFARVAVPVPLQKVVGKIELIEPLGPDRKDAIFRLPSAVARFNTILADAKRGVSPALPPVSIHQVVHDHYAAELSLDQLIDLAGEQGRPYSRGFNEWGADAYLRQLRKVATGIMSDAERTEGLVAAPIGWAIDRVTEGKGAPARGSKAYLDLAQALAQAQIEAIERTRERDRGDWTGEPSYRLLKERPIEPSPEKAPVSIDGLFRNLPRHARAIGQGRRGRQALAILLP